MILTLLLVVHILLLIIGSLFIFLMIIIMLGILNPNKKPPEDTVFINKPIVTVQLPIFNEGELVEQLVKSVTQIEYPKSKLQIQLLDDSNDGSYEIAKKIVDNYEKKGYDIEILHRENRNGFKAGALNNGMKSVKGEYIIILDADFIPPINFIERTLPYFSDEKISFVKTAIKVTNRDSLIANLYSSMVTIATQLEQVGRDRLDLYQPVSGSSFIIRKTSLLDVGCWSSDTLVEDNDISYALYLKSWKSAYVPEIYSDCYAPANLKALSIQQYRWSKGTIQCFFKYWKEIISNKKLTKFKRLVALGSGSQYIFFLLSAISFITGSVIGLFFFMNPGAMPLYFYTFIVVTTPFAFIYVLTMLLLFYKRGYSAKEGLIHLICVSILFYFIVIPSIKGTFSILSRAESTFIPTPK